MLIASFAGITKMAAMKGCGKVCPGAYNSVRINAFRSLLCAAVARGGETKEFSGNSPERAAAQTEKTAAERSKAAAITAAYIVLLVLSNAGVSITQKLYPARTGKEYAPFFNLMTFFAVCACFLAALLAGKAFAGKRLLPENAASGKNLRRLYRWRR